MQTNKTTTGDRAQDPGVYEWTGPTGVHFRDIREPSGTYYRDTTPRAVVDALERARVNRSRVRLFLGDGETGEDWGESYDVAGRVGRTMGPIHAPILLASERSIGGGIISTDGIVRLFINGCEVYRHPKYKMPEFEIRAIGPNETCGKSNLLAEGYVWAVDRLNGDKRENVANFRGAHKRAQRWIDFMQGRRMTK